MKLFWRQPHFFSKTNYCHACSFDLLYGMCVSEDDIRLTKQFYKGWTFQSHTLYIKPHLLNYLLLKTLEVNLNNSALFGIPEQFVKIHISKQMANAVSITILVWAITYFKSNFKACKPVGSGLVELLGKAILTIPKSNA